MMVMMRPAARRSIIPGMTAAVQFMTPYKLTLMKLFQADALVSQNGFRTSLVGVAPAFPVAEARWSWFANIGDYAVIGGFMLAEYGYRRLRFPAQARGLLAFLQRMARLGPSFWREALR